jgi:nitrile hydratase
MSPFTPGDRVMVRPDFPPGHIRTPVYMRGHVGVIDRCFGEFGDAEALAYGLKGPKRRVYKVRFAAADLWPDYKGPAHDVIEADLAEHWLEKLA